MQVAVTSFIMLLNVLTQVMQIDAETSCLDIQLVTQLSTDVMTVHVLEHTYLHSTRMPCTT